MNEPGFSESAQMAELSLANGEVLVAEVVVETHPVMAGRVLVKGQDVAGRSFEDWLPCMDGLNIGARDRVLVQRPGNSPEPLVTGIVESAQARRRPVRSAQTLTLQENESLTINDYQGRALIDIASTPSGPSIQLHAPLAELDVKGALRLEADSLEFKARQGEMQLSASGDIKVDGEMIKLN
ncbi:MAG: hypothetical protein AB8B87_09900 [Granulosicoccus sp.]